jgi:hypothetical protein
MNLIVIGLLVFILVVSILVRGLAAYVSSQHYQEPEATWERLAVANNLRFTLAESHLNYPRITGEYRGYQILLEIIQVGGRKDKVTDTHITLFRNGKHQVRQKKVTMGCALLPFNSSKKLPKRPRRDGVLAPPSYCVNSVWLGVGHTKSTCRHGASLPITVAAYVIKARNSSSGPVR